MGKLITLNRPIVSPFLGWKIARLFLNGSLAQGQLVHEFENEFSRLHGASFGVAFNSGTSALYSCLMHLNLKSRDEVIVPAFSFIATANAVILAGGTPVFADVSRETMNLDLESLRKSFVAGKTRAVVFVPLFGSPEGLREIAAFCRENDCLLILDAAQSHLAAVDSLPIAKFAHATVFSFYPTKNMTTAEGGMVVTESLELAEFLRRFRNQGMERRYDYKLAGMNLRLTEIQGLIGLEQLKRLERWTEARSKNAQSISRECVNVQFQTCSTSSSHVYHQLTLRSSKRDAIKTHLESRGIESAVYYPQPLSDVEHCKKLGKVYHRPEGAEELASTVLSIPVHPRLSVQQIRRIIQALAEVAW